MAHRVCITPEAEADIRSIGDFIVAQHAPMAAGRFIKALRRRINLLKTFPEAYGRAPEALEAGVDLRQMMHGMYRVLYTVESGAVTIHAIRHGARRPLRPRELPGQDK